MDHYRKLRKVEVLPNYLLTKTIRKAKEINKSGDWNQKRMTGYKGKSTVGFIEGDPQDRQV